jgi:hypothetical protein
MGLAPGTGRRERAILSTLDGVPRDVRELAAEIVGREPTRSEYNSLSRASHNLAALGLLQITRVPRGPSAGPGAPRAILRKVGRWVADSDGATATDSQMSHQQWLDAAWAAFGQDWRYGEALCAAAAALLAHRLTAAEHLIIQASMPARRTHNCSARSPS